MSLSAPNPVRHSGGLALDIAAAPQGSGEEYPGLHFEIPCQLPMPAVCIKGPSHFALPLPANCAVGR